MKKYQYYTIAAALFGIWAQLIPEPMKTFCLIVSIFCGVVGIMCGITGK